jgi:hypothetical protein
MFGWIGTVLGGIGSKLMTGLAQVGSFLKNTVGVFLGKIGTAIQGGWNWLKDSVSGLFNGDAGKVAKTLTENGVKANPTTSGALNSVVLESADNLAAQGLDLTRAASISSSTPMGGLTGDVVQGAREISTGAVGAVAGKSTGLKGTFDSLIDFFSTDSGSVLGKGAVAFATVALDNTMKKRQLKAAQDEAKRQEEAARRDWLMQQQRESQMKSWEAERSTQVDRSNRLNKWSGLTGEIYSPNDVAPQPVRI